MPSCTTSGFAFVMTSSITLLYTAAVEESCMLPSAWSVTLGLGRFRLWPTSQTFF